jgi:hypothetical protein
LSGFPRFKPLPLPHHPSHPNSPERNTPVVEGIPVTQHPLSIHLDPETPHDIELCFVYRDFREDTEGSVRLERRETGVVGV